LKNTLVFTLAALVATVMLIPPEGHAGTIEDLLAYAMGGYSSYGDAQYGPRSPYGTNYAPQGYGNPPSGAYGGSVGRQPYPPQAPQTAPGGYTIRYIPPKREQRVGNARLAANYPRYNGANYRQQGRSNQPVYRAPAAQRTWSPRAQYGGYSNAPYYSYQSGYGYGLGYGYGYGANCGTGST
jgi:hypothetical protein